MRIGRNGVLALAVGGAALVACGVGLLRKRDGKEPLEHATSAGFTPSTKRIERRNLIDREKMASVYEAKPVAYKAAKRVFDVALSGIALVGLSPILAATAVAILIEDGKPIFYVSERPGKDMKPFGMLKFRSMYKDADKRLEGLLAQNEQTGAAFKIKDDPRVTKTGRFIRKYSIDELPQLINVIRGECSIVGPRAIVPVKEYDAHERQRQLVQPGLTCYWQVMGRANIPWEEWVELDLDYIQDMGPATDISLIAKTFGVVLKGTGSY